MDNIKIKVKLTAYTKGIIPDTSNFIEDVPENSEGVYLRKHKEWVPLNSEVKDQFIIAEEGSGLEITPIQGTKNSNIKIKQLLAEIIPEYIEDDTTYYIIENTPDIYINGGTAFSDGNNEFIDLSEYNILLEGGGATTYNYDLNALPLNAKGEYNGE